MRRNGSVLSAGAAFVLAMIAHASPACADFVTYTGSQGSLAASVTFEVSGGNLIVTLTNTSSMDVVASNQLLTGVWFSLPGTLTPVSANVASGSSVYNNTTAGNNAFPSVGGEFAYKTGLSNSWGANSGISSSGMDNVFGPGNRFSTTDLDPPTSPNGSNYGITSAGDNLATANGGIADEPIIKNSVVFVLSGWNSNWTLDNITNVFFQYGTSQNEPRFPGVPEPGTVALMTAGLIGLVFAARKFGWA